MAQLECAFQIRFSNVNYVKVNAIKYRAVFNRSYLFEIEDQPIDLHPDFGLILKGRKNIKNGDFYPVSLTGASLDRYYDKATERFKFNGKYLKPEYEEVETEKYNPGVFFAYNSLFKILVRLNWILFLYLFFDR